MPDLDIIYARFGYRYRYGYRCRCRCMDIQGYEAGLGFNLEAHGAKWPLRTGIITLLNLMGDP